MSHIICDIWCNFAQLCITMRLFVFLFQHRNEDRVFLLFKHLKCLKWHKISLINLEMSFDKYRCLNTRMTENLCGNECTISNRMIRYDVESISTWSLLSWLPTGETKTERIRSIWHNAQWFIKECKTVETVTVIASMNDLICITNIFDFI